MTVVVLHGFTGRGSTVRDLADRIDPAATTPDLAGHGAEPHRADPDDYTVEGMADAVLAAVDGPVDLVGYSMGGRVAFTAACRNPERVRSLTLIGASAGLAGTDERAARVENDEALARLIEDDLPTFVDRWMANPLFATQARLGADHHAAARAQRLANDPTELAASLRRASTGRMAPLHDLLGQCTMPVGLVVGADDPKFRAIAADLAAGLPAAAIHTIGGAGHATHLEQLDATATVARATIARGAAR